MEHNHVIAFSEDGLKAIQDHIENLRVDLGAAGAILFDESGQLLTECGEHGDLDVTTFLSLLGNAMSASNAVIHLLRDEAAFDLHFHEGHNHDLHTVRISDRIFITLIFERHTGSSRVGMVWISLRRAVTELRSLLKKATIESGSAESDQIKTAVSDAVDETLSLFDEAILPGKTPDKTPRLPSRETLPPQPLPEPTPPLRSRRHKPVVEDAPAPRRDVQVSRPKRERMLKVGDIFSPRQEPDAPKPAAKPSANVPENTKEFPWSTFGADQPAEEPVAEKPSAPNVSPDILNNPNHVLTYDEARALGLINLDEPTDESIGQ